MFGNWIFTATDSGRPVGDVEGASVAVWTCPIDAAANGRRSKLVKFVAQSAPRELLMTFWGLVSTRNMWGRTNVLPSANLACNAHCLVPV